MKSDNNQHEDPLEAQLKTLEMEWKSIKQSISRSDRRNPSTTTTITTTTSTTSAVDNNRLFHLHENSPKELMSLLQHETPPSKPQIHDSVNDGFHTDRAPPIESIGVTDDRSDDFGYGGLKGRRLFEEESDLDSNSDESEGECEGLEMAEEREVCREFSSYEGCENDDHDDDENCDWISGGGGCVGSTVAVAVEGGGGGWVRRLVVISMKWIGVVVMMFAFGIVAFKCKGEDEQFLVPT